MHPRRHYDVIVFSDVQKSVGVPVRLGEIVWNGDPSANMPRKTRQILDGRTCAFRYVHENTPASK